MAEVVPFRAFRYNADRVCLQDVVTQPYDKITPEMQEAYYRRSPHNLVRIILGKPQDTDSATENVYTRAAASFRDWRTNGILQQDAELAIYLYDQSFKLAGDTEPRRRSGFIALSRLYDYSEGVVFRHEQTLSKPKSDRLHLLRGTRAHFGQIFMLYSDPAESIANILAPVKRSSPDVAVTDEYRTLHELWRVSDPSLIAAVSKAMADKKLIIADGHHRYETALNYRNECRANCRKSGPHDFAMMTFINMDSRGIEILPTHRVITGLARPSAADFLRKADPYFTIARMDQAQTVNEMLFNLRQRGKDGSIFLAWIKEGAPYWLKARPDAIDHALPQLTIQQRRLDVTVLHKIILEHLLGLSEADVREQKNVEYYREASRAIERMRPAHGGVPADFVFLLNPVSIEQLRSVAFAGEVMPQKSTDFYPKLLSGLTIYALD